MRRTWKTSPESCLLNLLKDRPAIVHSLLCPDYWRAAFAEGTGHNQERHSCPTPGSRIPRFPGSGSSVGGNDDHVIDNVLLRQAHDKTSLATAAIPPGWSPSSNPGASS